MLIESDLDAVRRHTTASEEPADFDEFWRATLAEAQGIDLNVRVQRIETVLSLVDVYDITFRGAGGSDVKAWLRVPAGRPGRCPPS
jgi:cephalosporin-C deacetylase